MIYHTYHALEESLIVANYRKRYVERPVKVGQRDIKIILAIRRVCSGMAQLRRKPQKCWG